MPDPTDKGYEMTYKFKDSTTDEVIVIESETKESAIIEALRMSPTFVLTSK